MIFKLSTPTNLDTFSISLNKLDKNIPLSQKGPNIVVEKTITNLRSLCVRFWVSNLKSQQIFTANDVSQNKNVLEFSPYFLSLFFQFSSPMMKILI